MILSVSDWIAIAAIGAGALMSILRRRALVVAGLTLLVVGMGGLAISIYRGNDSSLGVNSATSTIEAKPTGSSPQNCIIRGGTNNGTQIQNCSN